MKNMIYAAGLLTAGVASLALSTSLQAQDGTKRWTLGLGVRGFYDDNIFTRPDRTDPVSGLPLRLESWGIDVSPSINFDIPLEQGRLDFGYTYGLRYFTDRPGDDIDHSHLFTGNFTHNFSPRYKLGISESFAMAQEPEQLATSAAGVPTFFRSNGDNIRNSGGIIFTAQISDPISLDFSYNNNYYDYDDPQYSQALDRIEHLIGANFRYQFRPTTFGLIGYQYGIYDYTSSRPAGQLLDPQTKDQNSHFIFIGADHNFTPKFVGSARVGVQIAEWDQLGVALDQTETQTTPYADASVTYTFSPGNSVRAGIKYQRNATDLFDEYLRPVLDTETASGYLTVTYKITEKLSVAGTGLIQNAKFFAPGSVVDGQDELYWNLGITFSYHFTRWLAGEASYYYDNLDSDILQGWREYDRNRVFFGVRLTY
jgi:hypothetical protein